MTTGIEWTDRTINPGIYGCSKISPACTNCYAMGMAARLEAMGLDRYAGTTKGGQWTREVRVNFDAIAPAFAKLPKRKPAMVFVTSMSDLFHESVPFKFIGEVFREMEARPHLTFQVLTKRADRMANFRGHHDAWPRNVWAGVTVEDQQRADERIPHLLMVRAAVRFLSVEPMLSAINLEGVIGYTCTDVDGCGWRGHGGDTRGDDYVCPWCYSETVPVADSVDGDGIEAPIHWVICGGESGPNARPMHPDWARSLRDQCRDAGVPFFFKQWGKYRPGRLLDGREHNDFPEVTR